MLIKQHLILVICAMALLFAGCDPNAPATSSKVETGAASDITNCSVVLHGVVNVDISLYEDIEFGIMISESKENMNARKGEMSKADVLLGKDFTVEFYRLNPETKYYYCAWLLLNNTQYEFGSIKNFITLEAASSGITCPEKWLEWKAQNELWLANNAKQEGVITTPTGLQYKCIFAGHESSPRPDEAKMVTIKYSGKLINGDQFEASNSYVGYVSDFIPGLCEGLKMMQEFGIYDFYIPYNLGYGTNGLGTEGSSSHIPPYSTLIFQVELKRVN